MNFEQNVFLRTGSKAAFGNGAYVLVADNAGRVQRSTNLTTWTAYAFGGSSEPSIAFGGTSNRFVIISGDAVNGCVSPASVRYSSDGITWASAATSLTPATNNGHYYIAGSPDAFIAMFSSGIWRSTDGNTWTNITADTNGAPTNVKVYYVNGRFVIMSSTVVYSSITGAAGTWSQVGTLPSGVNGFDSDLTWNGSMYIASSTGINEYSIRYSYDLITWGFRSVTPGGFIRFRFSGVIGEKFMATNTDATTAAGGALVAKSVYSMTSDGYDFATQFPVPSSAILAPVSGSPAIKVNPFIKT
jgi:hypothetical protein